MVDIIFWFSDGQLVLISAALLIAIVWFFIDMEEKNDIAMKKHDCKIGNHTKELTTSNWHYDYYRCHCGKKWKMISKH